MPARLSPWAGKCSAPMPRASTGCPGRSAHSRTPGPGGWGSPLMGRRSDWSRPCFRHPWVVGAELRAWEEAAMHASMAAYLVHFSNILMLVSYSVRDILWLRWFAVAAALTNMPYFLLQQEILWPPVLWAGVFTAINLYQIA